MNELKVVEQREVLGKDFKIYGDFENPLFFAKDVAAWIEHSQADVMIKNVDESEKVLNTIKTLGGLQESWFLTEDGLYEILMTSRKPIAKQFKKEVKQILKDIRKNGLYATERLLDDPDLLINALLNLKAERESKKKLESEIAAKNQIIGELKPKADYVDWILQNTGLVNINAIAKDYGMSARQMNKILHELKVQYHQDGQWLLYAKYQSCGYTHSKTIDFQRTDGRSDVRLHTQWTQKGRLFIYELLKTQKGILPLIEQ